jgi:hypothetical protein
VKPESNKYIPGRDTQVKMRDRLSESDRVRSISGSFPPDLGLIGPGCQKWRRYLKGTSDASFHTFRLTFCRAFSTVAVIPD